MDQVKEFLNRLREDPKAREMVSGKEAPKSIEEEVGNYLRAAESLGYHITGRELLETVRAMDKSQKALTGEAETAIGKAPLNEETLDAVAGGTEGKVVKDHNECEYTYTDYENCWFNDECNIIFTHYDEPQNTLDIDYWQMCSSETETYENKFDVDVDAW